MTNESETAWFHVILTTYGSWLPGDPRGFRTRKHREHVEGDYKNPPEAGQYESLHDSAKSTLKHDSVSLNSEQRQIVSDALREKLHELGVPVACSAVSARHAHFLVELPKNETRTIFGAAKRHTWHEMNDRGRKEKLWAKRPKFVPVRDAGHWRNVFFYILRHEEEGAVVWRWDEDEGFVPLGVPPDAAGGL